MSRHDEMSILSEMFMAISWWSIRRWNPSCDLFRRLRGVTSVWSLFAGAPSVTLMAVSRVLTLEGKCAAGTPSPLYFYGCHEFVWPWLHKNTKGQGRNQILGMWLVEMAISTNRKPKICVSRFDPVSQTTQSVVYIGCAGQFLEWYFDASTQCWFNVGPASKFSSRAISHITKVLHTLDMPWRIKRESWG